MTRAQRSEFVKASERRIWRITAVSVVAIVGMTLAVLALIQTRGAVDKIKAERAERRTQVDAQIRQLACLLISQTPDDPRRPLIAEFRAKYECPPYSKANARNAFKPSPRATPTPTPTRTVTVAVPGPTVTVQAAPRTAYRTVTVAPGHGKTATKTATRTVAPTCTLAIGGKCVTLAPLYTADATPKIHGKGKNHR